jgi:hypothetical protein
MKIYKSNCPEIYCRIGRALVRFDFKDGLYKTDNPLFQKAIENSPHFKEGRITIE